MRSPLPCLIVLASALCLTGFVPADETDGSEKEKEVTYKNDYSDQDLSNKVYSGKNLDNTNFENCNLTYTKFDGCSLKNCNFQGANVNGTDFKKADLTGSDIRFATFDHPQFFYATLAKVNFSGTDLTNVDLNNGKLAGANFSKVKGMADIYKADFTGANFRGANMKNAKEHVTMQARFRKAEYDEETMWFEGFEPAERGLILKKAEDEPKKKKPAKEDEPADSDKPSPKSDSNSLEEEFTALDTNEDGVLTGKEMSKNKALDANGDGEVSLAEYLKKGK